MIIAFSKAQCTKLHRIYSIIKNSRQNTYFRNLGPIKKKLWQGAQDFINAQCNIAATNIFPNPIFNLCDVVISQWKLNVILSCEMFDDNPVISKSLNKNAWYIRLSHYQFILFFYQYWSELADNRSRYLILFSHLIFYARQQKHWTVIYLSYHSC